MLSTKNPDLWGKGVGLGGPYYSVPLTHCCILPQLSMTRTGADCNSHSKLTVPFFQLSTEPCPYDGYLALVVRFCSSVFLNI